MKIEIVLLITLSLCLFSCDKDDETNNSNNNGYPDGVSIIDLESENDCFLPECSEDRIVRLTAKNVNGKIFKGINDGRYGVSYRFSFDSSIHFYFCDLPEEFQEEDLLVSFDGSLIDACGVLNPVWPVEEAYFINLSKIELQ